jgi:Fructose-2,6-bisphosphatase
MVGGNMGKKSNIVLMRHSESKINKDMSLLSDKSQEEQIEINTNSGLSEKGVTETREFSERLFSYFNSYNVKIYVSDFYRSFQTGAIISKRFEECIKYKSIRTGQIVATRYQDCGFVEDKRINEINLLKYDNGPEMFKKILRELRNGFGNPNYSCSDPEIGKILNEKYLEMVSFLNEIEGNAIVVSHMLALSSLFMKTGVENEEKIRIANCDAFIYEKESVKRLIQKQT